MTVIKLVNTRITMLQDLRQITAIFIVTLCAFTSGALFTWPTLAIPILMDGDETLTMDDLSYLAVFPGLGLVATAPIFAYLTDKIGRKNTMLISAVPQLLSWLLTAVDRSIATLYISRFLTGLVDSVYLTTVSAYIGEIATPKVRGTWGNFIVILYYFGSFLAIVSMNYLLLENTAYIFSTIPVLFFLGLLWIPESPYYLVMKERRDEAYKSLQWLRWTNDVKDEYDQICVDVKRQLSETSTWKDLVVIRSNRKGLIVGSFLRLAQEFGGISAIAIYAQVIFRQSGDASATPTVIFNAILVVTNAAAAIVLDRVGRRLSMILSCLGCAILLCLQSIYFYLDNETDVDTSSATLIPVVGLSIYLIFYAMGLGVMPTLMLSELFSSSVKAKSLFLMNIAFAVLIAICTKVFQLLMSYCGMYVAFGFFAATSFACAFVSHFVIPETSGKTLEEIQQNFKQ